MDYIDELIEENERQQEEESKMTNEELALKLEIEDNEMYWITE